MTLLDVCHGFSATCDCVEKVDHVASDGGRHMSLQIFFRTVFRILIQFHGNILMHSVGTSLLGDEIIAVDAQFEGAFVSVKESGPRVGGIR